MLAAKTKLTSLTEQILQILPSYCVGKLNSQVNIKLDRSCQRKRRDVTNVGDVDLTATTTTTTAHATSESTTKSSTTCTTIVTAATSCWWASESGFGLTILFRGLVGLTEQLQTEYHLLLVHRRVFP
jgi:hypothetical protein